MRHIHTLEVPIISCYRYFHSQLERIRGHLAQSNVPALQSLLGLAVVIVLLGEPQLSDIHREEPVPKVASERILRSFGLGLSYWGLARHLFAVLALEVVKALRQHQ